MAEKVRSAAHQEYNKAEVLSDVADRIKDGKDIFGRNASFVQVEIDETFPEYLRENQEEYSFLILKEEPPVKRGCATCLAEYAGLFSGQAIWRNVFCGKSRVEKIRNGRKDDGHT